MTFAYSDNPVRDAAIASARDRWLDPPAGVSRCRCEGVCDSCERPRCGHGEDDERCECRPCEGGPAGVNCPNFVRREVAERQEVPLCEQHLKEETKMDSATKESKAIKAASRYGKVMGGFEVITDRIEKWKFSEEAAFCPAVFSYPKGGWIELHSDGRFHVVIMRQEWEFVDLEAAEKCLFEEHAKGEYFAGKSLEEIEAESEGRSSREERALRVLEEFKSDAVKDGNDEAADAFQFAEMAIAANRELAKAAKLAEIELRMVTNAEVESNALPDLRAAIAQHEALR